jgi:nucleoside-diphosphate kinase
MFRRPIIIASLAIVVFFLVFCFNVKNNELTLQKEVALSIIKSDAVSENNIGEVITRYEKNGLRVAGMKMVKLSEQEASEFYAVQRGRPHYDQLVETLTSEPVVLIVLEGDNAVTKNIELMGKTPSNTKNTLHLSENPNIAEMEVSFFFKPEEVN